MAVLTFFRPRTEAHANMFFLHFFSKFVSSLLFCTTHCYVIHREAQVRYRERHHSVQNFQGKGLEERAMEGGRGGENGP